VRSISKTVGIVADYPRRVLDIAESVSRSDKKYAAARFEQDSSVGRETSRGTTSPCFCAIHCLPSSATTGEITVVVAVAKLVAEVNAARVRESENDRLTVEISRQSANVTRFSARRFFQGPLRC